jgi:hypothetical protein
MQRSSPRRKTFGSRNVHQSTFSKVGLPPYSILRSWRRSVRQVLSIWTSYASFCEESAGVSAEKLAAMVLEPVVEGIEGARARAEKLGWKPTRTWSIRCARGWRRRGRSCRRGVGSVGLRSSLKKLERAAERDMITFRLKDGTTARFYEDEVWPECMVHELDRSGRHFDGEDPGPAHPFVKALRDAAPGEVERLVPTQGTIIQLFLGEDEIVRGLRERPGPPVRETSPGVYE